jgi:5-methylcytosine-specific restriction endonuclease McrA
MTYKEKLRDPRWQRKRLEIFQRDDFTCVICRAKTRNIQVHHIVYCKFDPWDYPNHLLQTLCEDCHERRQELSDKAANAVRIALSLVPNESMELATKKLIAYAMEQLK